MAAELKVTLGVDPKGLDTGLGKASDQLKQFDATVKKETKAVGVSFQGMGRVIQDVAFGPGAIANNLEGLGNDFKRLKDTAVANNQTLTKTVIASLTGPGGLTLALSGVTLAMSLASFGLSAWTRFLGKSDKETKSAKQSLNEYIDSLKAVDQAQLKGGQNAQQELATINALFHTYQDANVPLKARKEAYSELQQQYPDYFGSLKFEKETSEKVKTAYEQLTQSILASGRARAAVELIAGKSSQILVNEQKIADSKQTQVQLTGLVDRLTKSAQRGEIDYSQAIQSQIPLLEHRNAQVEAVKGFQAENAKLTKEILALEKEVSAQMVNEGKLIDDNKKKDAEATEARISNMKRITDQVGLGLTPINTDLIFNVDFNRFTGLFRDMGDGIKTPDLKLLDPKKLLDTANKNLDIWKQGIANKFMTDIGPFLEGAMESAFGGLAESIGEALASGGSVIDAFGQSVLASIGDILMQFGKLTIAAGVAALGLSKALMNPTSPASGAAAIAAGAALLAVGAAVKSFSKRVSASGSHAGGSAPRSAPGGFQAASPGSSFAGTAQMQLIPSTTIKGSDIVIAYNRQTSLNVRQGV